MLNMDMTQSITLDTNMMDWEASPAPGVWRKKLAREEAERGHATSIVRYDPGASFSAHDHPLGEEILVLTGTFSDHTGDYPKASYLRNTPGFVHAPFSKSGCIILVKLHQIQAQDTKPRRINYADLGAINHTNNWEPMAGYHTLLLHEYSSEYVRIIKSEQTSSELTLRAEALEIYVISGCLNDTRENYSQGMWLRRPAGVSAPLVISPNTLIWIKTGHF
ncbi:anti-ECFsigma factor, ChrR [Alteromonadaceae bacterium Bs31]|nr:anti-ECFsigma factor, ChrR [Alteromonadaceae bacterium Bs31]